MHCTRRVFYARVCRARLVGYRIEISNSFLEDFKKVIAFVAYINKSPSQEGDLGGG